MTVTKLPLLVIGGGIGGLTAALSLAQRGRKVHLIERALEFREIGAGIQIAPNASRVFEQLGLLDELRSSAVFPARIVWMDMISGKQLTYLDLGRAFLERYEYPYMVMHRSDLLDVVLNACRAHPNVTLENGRVVESIADCTTYMDVTCRDGQQYHAEVVVAADGIGSTARRLIDPVDRPQYDRFVAYRGAIPIESISEHAGLDNLVLWSGPDRHFIQYPLRRGELYNQVAVFRSPNPSPDPEDWGSPAELDAAYADACPPVQRGLRLLQRDRRWVMADRPPLERWTVNRLVLLGDAAHPMYQYAAQGACQAIEDAAALAESIAAEAAIPAAFAAYESKRVGRTAQVQRTARWFGETMHLRGAGADFRNTLLRERAPDDYRVFDFLYGFGTEFGRGAPSVDDLVPAVLGVGGNRAR